MEGPAAVPGRVLPRAAVYLLWPHSHRRAAVSLAPPYLQVSGGGGGAQVMLAGSTHGMS